MTEVRPAPGEAARRSPRWVGIALVASLAVNFLTIGLIAASLWEWRLAAATWPHRFPAQLAQFARTLPASRADELGRLVDAAEPEIRALRREARGARRDAGRLFRAEPLDKGQFVAAQQRLLEADTNARRAQMRLIADVAERMSAEERRAFLEWRRQHMPASWRRQADDREDAGNGPDAAGPKKP